MNVSNRTLKKWDNYLKKKNGKQNSKSGNKSIHRSSDKAQTN